MTNELANDNAKDGEKPESELERLARVSGRPKWAIIEEAYQFLENAHKPRPATVDGAVVDPELKRSAFVAEYMAGMHACGVGGDAPAAGSPGGTEGQERPSLLTRVKERLVNAARGKVER